VSPLRDIQFSTQPTTMKQVVITLLLAVPLLFSSCKKESGSHKVAIDIQASFDQDHVQVFLDGNRLINNILQTNYVLSLCMQDGQVSVMENQGRHKIEVIVNNSVSESASFVLSKDLYIGVQYDRQLEKVSFIYSDTPFMYD
jgi:hypothetical protein